MKVYYARICLYALDDPTASSKEKTVSHSYRICFSFPYI